MYQYRSYGRMERTTEEEEFGIQWSESVDCATKLSSSRLWNLSTRRVSMGQYTGFGLTE